MERERRSSSEETSGTLEVQVGVRDVTSPIAVLGITDFGNNWEERARDRISRAERHQFWQVDQLFHFRGDLRVRGPIESSKWYLLEREEARDQTFHWDSGRR